MKISSIAIASFAKFMIGGEVFNEIKTAVGEQFDSDKTNAQKRASAIKGVKAILGDIADWTLNLGIELAVAWFKSKAK